jgi:hypothetical protein
MALAACGVTREQLTRLGWEVHDHAKDSLMAGPAFVEDNGGRTVAEWSRRLEALQSWSKDR